MRLEATRESKTFAERMNILTNYISPFKQMWPFYWLKAAAIRDSKSSLWQLRYFSLVGRWSENKPIPEVCDDTATNILAINRQIDVEKAWELLTSLQANGTVELLPGVTVVATPEPDTTFPTASYWQESLPFQKPRALAEVTEPVKWLYLHLSESSRKGVGIASPNEVKHEVENRLRSAVQDDLEVKGLNDFAHFTATRLGLGYGGREPNCSIDDFFYQFDLPLALHIQRGIPDRSGNMFPLTIYCQRPLKLECLQVCLGDIWLPGADILPLSIEVSEEKGWSVGEVIVPYTCGKVWLKFDTLDKALAYDLPLPTREDQITAVLGSMYHARTTDQGTMKWRKHVLESNGTDFEIALLNALARLGIPVLFAGQLQQEAQVGGGGTSTAGYDLVALDHATRRATLISAKGSPQVPKDEVCQKLLDAVAGVQQLLPNWSVQGVIACHTPNNKLVRLKNQTAFRVWGYEDLERVSQADKREAIAPLLWAPPQPQSLAYRLGIGLES